MSLLKLKATNLLNVNRPLKQLKLNVVKLYSVQAPAVQDRSDTTNDQAIKDYDRLKNITPKSRLKFPQRPPFVKNLFLGVYDSDILTYPQMEKEHVDSMNQQLEPVKNFFIGSDKAVNNMQDDLMENLRRLKLFGLQSSQLLGGRELNSSETCRFNEIISSNTSATLGLLENDLLGIQAVIKSGSEDQKRKYLPQLIEGKILSAFCLLEKSFSEFSKLETRATLEPGKKFWVVNGEKTLVVNGGIANLFILVAQTEELNRLGVKEAKLTSFLVEKEFGEITSSPCEVVGLQDTNIVNLKFNNVRVPVENVLGEVNKAEEGIHSLMRDVRLNTGSACSALSRKLIDSVVDYCTKTNVENRCIGETDYVRSTVGRLCVSQYAVESTIFLTTGLIDQFENQDCELEAAIVKIFSSQETSRSVLKAMELIGTPTYLTNHWCNVLHRDSLSHLLLNETSENLKLKIALMGLQHAGLQMQEKIKKARNPLFYPIEGLKRMWLQRKQLDDDPQLTLRLDEYLHPSAVNISKLLEYCVLRLQFATDILFARHGYEIMNQHMELIRLADCAIDIYAMTACLGRASRAYCIGLQHADFEMLLTNSFCTSAQERVKYRVNEIVQGPYATNDETYRKIAEKAFKFNEYFPVHPLSRNF